MDELDAHGVEAGMGVARQPELSLRRQTVRKHAGSPSFYFYGIILVSYFNDRLFREASRRLDDRVLEPSM